MACDPLKCETKSNCLSHCSWIDVIIVNVNVSNDGFAALWQSFAADSTVIFAKCETPYIAVRKSQYFQCGIAQGWRECFSHTESRTHRAIWCKSSIIRLHYLTGIEKKQDKEETKRVEKLYLYLTRKAKRREEQSCSRREELQRKVVSDGGSGRSGSKEKT